MVAHFCRAFPAQKGILQDFFAILCNIIAFGAIISMAMVGAMAKVVERTEDDDLVLRARTQADALGLLYELYYERIFRFCVYRLFNKEIAEDVTSMVFLEVARRIRSFKGRSRQDFSNWLYAIAANQANTYIRKTSRRKKLLAEAAGSMRPGNDSTNKSFEPDWPRLYAAILKLKPEHQTIITLRFFENLQYEQISQILNIKVATLRVTLHRILERLRKHLKTVMDGEA
jgi:RNA polymerase sigma-70 factor (ECF subfamily)